MSDLTKLSKEELTLKIEQENRSRLESENEVEKLIIYNLENFAFRYLTTSTDENINVKQKENDFSITTIESNILEALKWKQCPAHAKLIDLCKQYPGNKSKEIKVQLSLSTLLKSDEITCTASISWDFPNFNSKEKGLIKEKKQEFKDPLELRNIHPRLLESVCEIF